MGAKRKGDEITEQPEPKKTKFKKFDLGLGDKVYDLVNKFIKQTPDLDYEKAQELGKQAWDDIEKHEDERDKQFREIKSGASFAAQAGTSSSKSSAKSSSKDNEKDKEKSVDQKLEEQQQQQQLLQLEAEFENLVKQIASLLAELGDLLELGTPPDPQKIALLKEKLKLLEMLRSRMNRLAREAKLNYGKEFNFDSYFVAVNDFIDKSKDNLAVLTKSAKFEISAQFLLDKQKDYEPLNEKAARLEKQMLLSKDPTKQQQLANQLELVHDQRDQLNNNIATELNNQALGANKDAVAADVRLQECAAAMYAELNGLVDGMEFGQTNTMSARSMTCHKTWAQVLADFRVSAPEARIMRREDSIHAREERLEHSIESSIEKKHAAQQQAEQQQNHDAGPGNQM